MTAKPPPVSPYLVLILPPLCWAGNFVVGRAIHGEIAPMQLTFWRWLVAAAALLPFVGGEAWRRRRILWRHRWLLVALAATGVLIFQYVVYRGLGTTTAINGVLIIATIPVVIPVVAFVLDRSTITLRQAVGIGLSLAGVATIILRGDWWLAEGLRWTAGDIWVAAAVPAWALYTVLLKRRPLEVSALTLLFAIIVVGLVLILPGYLHELTRDGGFRPSLATVSAILYVGLFASVLAFAAWNYGVARVGAAKAGLFIHLMPVFAALLAMLFLDERLHGYHAVGVALIVLGLYLSSRATPGGAAVARTRR